MNKSKEPTGDFSVGSFAIHRKSTRSANPLNGCFCNSGIGNAESAALFHKTNHAVSRCPLCPKDGYNMCRPKGKQAKLPMKQKRITEEAIQAFRRYLIRDEKSAVTVEKYLRDVRAFQAFIGETPVEKELVIHYKNHLLEESYAVRSINSMLASVNSFLIFMDWPDCKVKSLKVQRQVYCAEEKELTKAEYERLLKAAGRNEQLRLVMETLCSTGIRVSELKYFTAEAVRRGEVIVRCKAKTRTILLPGKLRRLLLDYAGKQKIRSGVIFLTGRGKPLDRKAIWAQMKGLCKAAGVKPGKVFPHNLRKLFARTFYGIEKDIAKLADILGHSSVDTTRIYIMTSGTEHRQKLERLGLVV